VQFATVRRASRDDSTLSESGRRISPPVAELLGIVLAVALTLCVVSHLAQTQAWMLYTDGDSVLTVLTSKSILLGQRQDWAMSPVLFLPESAVYGALSLLGLGVRATLTLNAVLNFFALYAALRVASGSRAMNRLPVAGALWAFGLFCALSLLEGGSNSGGFQLASLLATTTYYSSTIITAILTVGVVRRGLATDRSQLWPTVSGLVVLCGVSALTNPLYLGWTTVPAAGVLALLAITGKARPRSALTFGTAIALGSLLGYFGRGLFSGTVVADSRNYVRPGNVGGSFQLYGGLLQQTATTLPGALWCLVLAIVLAIAVQQLRRAWRTGDSSLAFVSLIAVAAPIVATAGAVLLGTVAQRYLQPWVFMPVLGLVAIPSQLASALSGLGRRIVVTIALGTVAVTLLASAIAVPPMIAVASTTDVELSCVVKWVERSGRTGAGQFWVARAPKAYIADPSRVIQVDNKFNPYTWLTNRTDLDHAKVSFLIEGDPMVPWAFPAGFDQNSGRRISCGRYSILDFGTASIPLGIPHS
jgi:hypothetical protein